MKKIKHILFTFIFSLVIGCQAIVSSAASLSDLQGGIYTIKNDVSHENETGMAMARSYVNESMTLEKSNGNWYYTIKFNGAQYMSKHAIYVSGSKVSHSVKSKDASSDTIELKFKTSSITPKLKVSMYVSAMGRNVEFGVIPKESTLKLVKATEEIKSESNTSNNSNKNNNSTSDSSNKTENSTNSSSNKTNNSTSTTTKTETKSEETEKIEEESDKTEEVKKEDEKEESDKDIAEEAKQEDLKEESDKDKTEETIKEVVSEASEEKSSNIFIFIGAGAIVVIAIIALVLKRIKK